MKCLSALVPLVVAGLAMALREAWWQPHETPRPDCRVSVNRLGMACALAARRGARSTYVAPMSRSSLLLHIPEERNHAALPTSCPRHTFHDRHPDFCTVARWDNGQIVEENLFYDLVTFMRQIGIG